MLNELEKDILAMKLPISARILLIYLHRKYHDIPEPSEMGAIYEEVRSHVTGEYT